MCHGDEVLGFWRDAATGPKRLQSRLILTHYKPRATKLGKISGCYHVHAYTRMFVFPHHVMQGDASRTAININGSNTQWYAVVSMQSISVGSTDWPHCLTPVSLSSTKLTPITATNPVAPQPILLSVCCLIRFF